MKSFGRRGEVARGELWSVCVAFFSSSQRADHCDRLEAH